MTCSIAMNMAPGNLEPIDLGEGRGAARHFFLWFCCKPFWTALLPPVWLGK